MSIKLTFNYALQPPQEPLIVMKRGADVPRLLIGGRENCLELKE